MSYIVFAMARSKKGARNLEVNGVKYRWRATGNDGWISLVVWPDVLPGPAIASSFGYHQTVVPLGEGRAALTKQLVITNRIVRRVIDFALQHEGYDPCVKGKQVDLRHVDRLIDISDAERGR